MKRRHWLTIGIATALTIRSLARGGRRGLGHRISAAQQRGWLFRARQPADRLNIRYKPGSAVTLDVYAPAGASGCPVVVSIHGGGWTLFRSRLFTFSAPSLVERGVIVVLPDYTLYPRAQNTQMADEVAAAVAWTLEHIADYGGDRHRVYLQGHSAGAQLAGLVGLDERYLAAYGHSTAELAGVALSGAVTDVEALHDYWSHRSGMRADAGPQWRAMGRSREGLRAASPVNHIRADAPPLLVLHGEADRYVPMFIPRAFYEKALAAGADVTWRSYPGKGHADALFDAALDPRAPLNEDLLAFIVRTSGPVAGDTLAARAA